VKAVILAAGQGTRLRPLTNDRPKCMVELQGKPLIDHQTEVLRHAGITDLHVVAGYLADRLNRPGVTKHINPDFATTNMVSTLFCAADLLTGDEDIVIGYGDIVYEARVLEALLACDAPLCLAVDLDWRTYWQARMEDPLADAETLKLTDDNKITELGKKPTSYDDIQGQYMGLIKIRADHVRKFHEVWTALDPEALYDGKDLPNMFMTSFLQHLIDTGWDVRAAFTKNGWLEVDAPEDLALDAGPFWKPHA
jgi:choline kinase